MDCESAFGEAMKLTRESPLKMVCCINKKIAVAEKALLPLSDSVEETIHKNCDLEERERAIAASERSQKISQLIGMLENTRKRSIDLESRDSDSISAATTRRRKPQTPSLRRDSQQRTRPQSSGAAARANARIQTLKSDPSERAAFNLRVAKRRKQVREAKQLLTAKNSDMIANNILVMREFSADIAIQRKELKDYQSKLRMNRVIINQTRNREEKRERNWLQAYKKELLWESLRAKSSQNLVITRVHSWEAIVICVRWMTHLANELRTRKRAHQLTVAEEAAKRIIARHCQPWLRSIRRRKAIRQWKTVRCHRPFLMLWIFVKKRRRSVSLITQFLRFKMCPNVFKNHVLRYRSNAIVIQRLFRQNNGRKALFQQLLLLQLSRAEERLLQQKQKSLEGRPRDSFMEVGRVHLRRQNHKRDKELADLDIDNIRVPVQYQVEQVERFYQSQLVQYIADLKNWRQERKVLRDMTSLEGSVIRRKSLFTCIKRPRPYIRMVWSDAVVEKILSGARSQMMIDLNREVRQAVGQKRYVGDSDNNTAAMNQARILMWSKSSALQTKLNSERIPTVPEC